MTAEIARCSRPGIPGRIPGRLRLLSRWPRAVPAVLLGRASEREVLDRLLENVRGGQSAVLVIRGEAGVGKTALLRPLRSAGRRASASPGSPGVESEMELPFAGLHQLCAPMLDRLDALPEPQQARPARRVRPGGRRRAGPLPGRPGRAQPAVRGGRGAAAAVRRRRRAVARRGLGAGARASSRGGCWPSRSAIVFAVREPDRRARARRPAGAGARRARRGGRARAARDGHPGPARRARPRPDRRRDARQPAGAAGAAARRWRRRSWRAGSACRGALPLPGRIEESFRRRLEALPRRRRRLLLVAAAEPVGRPAAGVARGRAARHRGRRPRRRRDADGLAGDRRAGAVPPSAGALGGLPGGDGAGAPGGAPALAEATDPQVDPDRRAWHRAQAAAGPGRGGRRGARALGRPGAGPRRAGRRGRVPGARRRR